MAGPVHLDDVKADTWTRSELLRARGYDEEVVAGNGHHPGGTSEGNGSLPDERPVPAGECLQCGQPSGGRRFCGESCRGKYRRAHADSPPPVAVQEPAQGRATDNKRLSVDSSGTRSDAFASLLALPGLLPPGWRLEATASSVTVSWQQGGWT